MRVLVVDDSNAVRARIVLLLKETPEVEAVREARDAEEALAALEPFAPDLVVLDVNMPGRSGLEILPSLKAARAPLVVVVLTNHPSEHHRRECLAHGADFFFDKSREFDRVLQVVVERARERDGGRP